MRPKRYNTNVLIKPKYILFIRHVNGQWVSKTEDRFTPSTARFSGIFPGLIATTVPDTLAAWGAGKRSEWEWKALGGCPGLFHTESLEFFSVINHNRHLSGNVDFLHFDVIMGTMSDNKKLKTTWPRGIFRTRSFSRRR